MLGDLTEHCDRGFLPSAKRFQTESTLLRWLHQMPLSLRLSDAPNDDNFTSRQLHLPYLMSVMIFARFTAKGVSRTAVLAASYCAGIFESFLSRDEVKFLAPVFTIYCISSGFTLLTLYHHPHLWSVAQADMKIILQGLAELSKTWRSAIGGLKALQSAIHAKERMVFVRPISTMNMRGEEGDTFFRHFPDQLCRLRAPFDTRVTKSPAFSGEVPTDSTFESQQDTNRPNADHQPLPSELMSSVYFFDEQAFDTGAVDLFGYDHFGSWLLNEPSIAALGGA
jgi:hypothetical protein